MSDTLIGPEQIEEESDLGTGDAALWSFWMSEDEIAMKGEELWRKKSRNIVKRYRAEDKLNGSQQHRFNILWSNVQTLMPILYARTPKPDVQRRWLDQDDTGRLASILLERCISYELDRGGFDAVMNAVVEDRLLPGRGVPRVLYVPTFGDEIESEPEEFEEEGASPSVVDGPGDRKPSAPREVVDEATEMTYVFWEDYLEGPARTWKQVPWVRYRAYMTRAELVDRFGAKGARVKLDHSPLSGNYQSATRPTAPPDIFRKAIIHEYWDKTKGRVIWLPPGTPDLILDQVDDPLGLPDFFPNPDPLLATTTNDKRVPVPDYVEYEDQAHELDKLTARIDTLTRALKVSGVYPGALKQELQQLVDEGTENKLIPVADWQMLMDKGGLAGAILWMPIKEIAETLIQLYAARDKTKELLYEITGIGDIMRGATQPLETATAQQLKSAFSTRRVQPQQRAVARLARDAIRLIGAIVAGHFSPRTISRITGYPQLLPVPDIGPPPAQWLPAPMQQAAPMQQPANDPGALPPEAAAQLKEGQVTRFSNGQRWTLQAGRPRMVA